MRGRTDREDRLPPCPTWDSGLRPCTNNGTRALTWIQRQNLPHYASIYFLVFQRIGCHTTPMRFIHTADIHLDQSCANIELPPNQGSEYRDHLHRVLQRILTRARDWSADAVFITGDLFEYKFVTRNSINQLREAFASMAPTPVFLCAGASDPAVPDSPYLTEPWSDNVHLFTHPAWRSVALRDLPLTVHGFGLNSSEALVGLPEGLPFKDDGRIHVALGYRPADSLSRGESPDGVPTEFSGDLPGELAYIGLGGLHTRSEFASETGTPIWYPGAPECCVPGHSGSFGFLEISVGSESDPTGATVVQPHVLSTGRFQALTLDCTGMTSGQDLLDAIRAELRARKDCPLIRLTLEGALLRQIYDEIEGIREVLSEEIQYLQWRENCQVGDDYELIAGERTSLGAFVQRISEEIGDAPDQALRLRRQRSRDLGVCAYRATPLPIKGLTGDYR